MFRAIDIMFLIVVLVGLLWYSSGRYIKIRKRNREPNEAYFTGGPLNGSSKKIKTYTDKYTYEYKKVVGSQDHGNYKTYDEEDLVAVYNYDGAGTYAYVGSLDSKGNVVQDSDA
jgi:hypothetical protein